MRFKPSITFTAVGALCGLVFSVPMLVILSIITVGIATFYAVVTYKQGLAFLAGLVAAIAALYFNLSMWIVAILVNGLVDFALFSWITR